MKCVHLKKLLLFSEFAASEPVAGLPEGALLQYFARLRQLLDLFMSWDWPTYFHDYAHESSKYNLVTPNMAVLLLEKWVNDPRSHGRCYFDDFDLFSDCASLTKKRYFPCWRRANETRRNFWRRFWNSFDNWHRPPSNERIISDAVSIVFVKLEQRRINFL